MAVFHCWKSRGQNYHINIKVGGADKKLTGRAFRGNSERVASIMSSSYTQLLQSCWALCGPMDHSPPGSSVHRILQARRLSGLLCPSGNFSHPGIEPASTVSAIFQADSLPPSHQGIVRANRLAANKGVTGFPS